MYQVTCDVAWQISNGTPVCPGVATVVEHRDIDLVFREYLSRDPEIISLVMGSALVFWLTGHWLGRVMRVFRKVS